MKKENDRNSEIIIIRPPLNPIGDGNFFMADGIFLLGKLKETQDDK